MRDKKTHLPGLALSINDIVQVFPNSRQHNDNHAGLAGAGEVVEAQENPGRLRGGAGYWPKC